MDNKLINWLLAGDPSIVYQVHRDLLDIDSMDHQIQIGLRGWGPKFLARRKSDGHWGMKYYQPKWTSSHYTLLDLRNLCLVRDNVKVKETIQLILEKERGPDGGINPSRAIKESDVCLNGMFLNIAAYFHTEQDQLESIIDFILSQQLPDGGFNCMYNRWGANHSSLHSTLSVLEGITEFEKNEYRYRVEELGESKSRAIEFILLHRLYLSDRTGKIIRPEFLRLPYPSRWKYDILRALDYLRYSGQPWDERMKPAMEVLMSKRLKDGRWPLNAPYPGQVHFHMENPGTPSRWNTLRALRVLKTYSKNYP